MDVPVTWPPTLEILSDLLEDVTQLVTDAVDSRKSPDLLKSCQLEKQSSALVRISCVACQRFSGIFTGGNLLLSRASRKYREQAGRSSVYEGSLEWCREVQY